MQVGILSDTHDDFQRMAAGVRLLRARGAEFLIHCGDVGSEPLLDLLAGIPSAFVWGNNDWDRATLERYADDLGITCLGGFGELELGGKQFGVFHGDDLAAKRRILVEQRYDYLLQGHTHVAADERVGRTRCINPGALYRAKRKTVALLDTARDVVQFLEVGER